MVKIFSIQIREPYFEEGEIVKKKIASLEKEVGDFVANHPKAQINWLQSTAAYGFSNSQSQFSRITAVVNYSH